MGAAPSPFGVATPDRSRQSGRSPRAEHPARHAEGQLLACARSFSNRAWKRSVSIEDARREKTSGVSRRCGGRSAVRPRGVHEPRSETPRRGRAGRCRGDQSEELRAEPVSPRAALQPAIHPPAARHGHPVRPTSTRADAIGVQDDLGGRASRPDGAKIYSLRAPESCFRNRTRTKGGCAGPGFPRIARASSSTQVTPLPLSSSLRRSGQHGAAREEISPAVDRRWQ